MSYRPTTKRPSPTPGMSPLDRPRLRPYLAAAPEDAAGRYFILHDRLRLSDTLIRLNPLQLEVIQLFDGSRTLREVQNEVMVKLGGQLVPLEVFAGLAGQLDQAL